MLKQSLVVLFISVIERASGIRGIMLKFPRNSDLPNSSISSRFQTRNSQLWIPISRRHVLVVELIGCLVIEEAVSSLFSLPRRAQQFR